MPVSANWFQVWFNSPYYHQLFEYQKHHAGGQPFLSALLKKVGSPSTAHIADLCCRQGNDAILLAGMGYDVNGIDLGGENIEAAKPLETDRLHFFQHDLRLPFWINYFDLAINLYNGFGFYRTEHEHYNAIRTVAQSIREDGFLVLDYDNTRYKENNLIPKLQLQIGNVDYLITKWFDETHFFRKIYIEDENLSEPLEFTERLTKFSLGDFTDMFAFHHLQIQQVFGDYNFSPYDIEKSPRLIMIAQKKPTPGHKPAI
ncbi:MAG: class I SAM-dependent methyltransferase [Chitinophagaceae bacterium]|nr:MAG: class I SAM-dependent methyltransferase [Chitinophagaceae bacterium]